jgi:hypothetical protein
MRKLTEKEFDHVKVPLSTGTLVPNIEMEDTCTKCYFDKTSFGCSVCFERMEVARPGYCGKLTNFVHFSPGTDINYNDHFYEIETYKRRKLNTE